MRVKVVGAKCECGYLGEGGLYVYSILFPDGRFQPFPIEADSKTVRDGRNRCRKCGKCTLLFELEPVNGTV